MLSMTMPQVVADRSPLAERADNQQTVGAVTAPSAPAPERRRRKRGGRRAGRSGGQNRERQRAEVSDAGALAAYAWLTAPALLGPCRMAVLHYICITADQVLAYNRSSLR